MRSGSYWSDAFGGSAAGGEGDTPTWSELYRTNWQGAGGALADTDTVTVDGVTWTCQHENTGLYTVLSQDSNGMAFTRDAGGSNSNPMSLRAAVADIDGDYSQRATYAIGFEFVWNTFTAQTNQGIQVGMSEYSGTTRQEGLFGEMYGFFTSARLRASEYNTAGNFASGYGSGDSHASPDPIPAWWRVLALIVPDAGLRMLFQTNASQQGLPAAADMPSFGAIPNGVGGNENPFNKARGDWGDFTHFVLRAYTDSSDIDIDITETAVYRADV